MQRRRFMGGLAVTAAAMTGPLWGPHAAIAHRARVTLTRVLANPRTARWECIHAIHYHDAATALRRLAPGEGLAPTQPQGQARLMLEVERDILWSSTGEPLTLTAVGAELSSDSLWLYQECAPLPAGTAVSIESRLLQRVFADQVNRFSIEVANPPILLTANAATPRLQFTV